MECTKCHGPAAGYKCDICGDESDAHDAQHACGADHCMPKCSGCSQAQVKCTCA